FLVEVGLFLLVGAGVTGCGHAPPAGQDTGPPTVTVAYPVQREVTDHAEYPGRTAAVDSLQVRARVGGYLEKINFKEGQTHSRATCSTRSTRGPTGPSSRRLRLSWPRVRPSSGWLRKTTRATAPSPSSSPGRSARSNWTSTRPRRTRRGPAW